MKKHIIMSFSKDGVIEHIEHINNECDRLDMYEQYGNNWEIEEIEVKESLGKYLYGLESFFINNKNKPKD